nr:uncharacterized protein LOC109184816 [Ipomoea batatas]
MYCVACLKTLGSTIHMMCCFTSIQGGLDSYTFSLYIRHGGRIEQSIPPKYLGGKIKTFRGIDSDEWGFITLKEKIGELGYTEGESEEELVSVDEECSEYDTESVDELEVDGSYADVNDCLNLSEETPIAAGSDGEVESTVWDSVKPPEVRRNLDVGEQREVQERQREGQGEERQHNAEPERSNPEPEVEAQTEGQEEMIIHTQPDVESETQEEAWNTSLFEIPVECHDSVIGMNTITVEPVSTTPMDFNCSTQGVNLNLGNTSRVEQHQKGMLMKAKGKQKANG